MDEIIHLEPPPYLEKDTKKNPGSFGKFSKYIYFWNLEPYMLFSVRSTLGWSNLLLLEDNCAFFWAAFLFTTEVWHAKKNRVACWSQLRGVRLVRQRNVFHVTLLWVWWKGAWGWTDKEKLLFGSIVCFGDGLPQRFSELGRKWVMCEEVDRRGCRL